MSLLRLKEQEIALTHPDACNMFRPSDAKPFVATPAAIRAFGHEVIVRSLAELQEKAREHDGLDYLQVFEDPATRQSLWFIEDGDGGAITALLPSDY